MTSAGPYLLIGSLFCIILVLNRLQRRWAVYWCRKYAEEYIEEQGLDAAIEDPGQYPPYRLCLHVWGRYWATLRYPDGRAEYLRIRTGLGTPVRFDVFPSHPGDRPRPR